MYRMKIERYDDFCGPEKMPYTWKYLQENRFFANWFIFGADKYGELVGIADYYESVLEAIPLEAAKEIIQARDEFLIKLEKINERLTTTP